MKKKIGLGYYFSRHKLGIALYIGVYALFAGCSIALTLVLAEMIEAMTDVEYSRALMFLGIAIGVVLVQRLLGHLLLIIYQKTSKSIISEMNQDLSQQAFKLDSKTYADHSTGLFTQRILQDPEYILENLSSVIDVFSDIISGAVIITYVAVINIYIGLIIFAMIIGCSILEMIRKQVKIKNNMKKLRCNEKVMTLTTEIVRSEKDIKSLGLEERLSKSVKEKYKAYQDANYHYEIIDSNFWSTRAIITDVVGLLALVLGIILKEKGLITLATFMVVYSYRVNFNTIVWCIGEIMNMIGEVQVHAQRMFSLFDENEFVTERFGDKHLDEVKGLIEFKNVAYNFIEYEKMEYPEKLTRAERKKLKKNPPQRKVVSENKIFKNLSFKIKPNTTVAFVGKSGSGKSTILNLMSKMYEVDKGQVLIDGVNINELDKETLRKNISLVNQFPYIFDMTIKENLLLAKNDATDEEIKNAIKYAALDDFIATLNKGLDTRVGESGIKLSGGQKQRLAMARAFLRKSSIIIFDESTSSLDNFAQGEVKKSIDSLKGKSTIVIVAHRLSTIRDVDEIFFLEDGKVIDSGTFDYLFENNVKFKNMFYAENLN